MQLEKTLSVIGESHFKTNALFSGWKRTSLKPFTELPIRWEYAFGGSHLLYKEANQSGAPILHEVCYTNPLGTGWVENDYFDQC